MFIWAYTPITLAHTLNGELMKIKFFSIVLIMFLFCIAHTNAFAIDDTNVVASAERVIFKLKNVFSKIAYIIANNSGNEWYNTRYFLIDEPSYDVKKTDSMVSPYMLIVNMHLVYDSNINGPNADGSDSTSKCYKSIKDARKYNSKRDFVGGPNVTNLQIFYALQKDVWVLKGGNSAFDVHIKPYLQDKENENTFKEIMIVTAMDNPKIIPPKKVKK